MLEGFTQHRIKTTGTEIHLRVGGKGPPVLLLHGYPQTHVMWHCVAPALAERFTVVCADLRGYGDSGRPETDPDHLSGSKRAMAADMVEVMTTLGFARFDLVGHDRGGRVAHRLCLDHPAHVTRVALLDIVPTRTLFLRTDMAIAMGYYHWFFLSQPEPLPERLIGGDPLFYLHKKLGHWSAARDTKHFAPEAMQEYERCFVDPAVIHATCEDYRAGATIDVVHDERTRTSGSCARCSSCGAGMGSCTATSTCSPRGARRRSMSGASPWTAATSWPRSGRPRRPSGC